MPSFLQAVSAPVDLVALAGTCRMLYALAADVPAGLRLKLKEHQVCSVMMLPMWHTGTTSIDRVHEICAMRPHVLHIYCFAAASIASSATICYSSSVQEVGVRWMLQRETGQREAPHPTVRLFQTAQGLPLWLCAGGGEAGVEAPPPCAPCRGGFVCDEPVSSVKLSANIGNQFSCSTSHKVTCNSRLEGYGLANLRLYAGHMSSVARGRLCTHHLRIYVGKQ